MVEIYQSEQQNTRKSNAFNAIHHSDSKDSNHQRLKEANHNNARRKKRSIARGDSNMNNRYDDSSGNRSNIPSSSQDNNAGPKHKSSLPKQTHFVYLIKVQETGKKLGDRTVYMVSFSYFIYPRIPRDIIVIWQVADFFAFSPLTSYMCRRPKG